MPKPFPIPLDACLDADQARPAIPAVRARVARALRVPRPTPDQVAYLAGLQAAAGDYDPDYLVRGRRPEDLPRD